MRTRWLLLSLVASVASAQVNVEGLSGDAKEEGVSGELGLQLAGSRGNVDFLEVGGTLSLRKQELFDSSVQPVDDAPPYFRRRFVLVIDREFGSLEDRRFADRGFAHARWTHMRAPRFGWDFFAQYQFDDFRRLRDRAIGGLGVRWDPLRTVETQLWMGSGYMLEHERIDVAPAASDEAESVNHRWTSYAVVRQRLAERNVTVQNVVYVQPRIDRFADFRILEVASLGVVIAQRFELRVELEVQHDSDPPRGVVPTDVRVRNAFSVRF